MAELLQVIAAVGVGLWVGRRLAAAILPDTGMDYTTALILRTFLEDDGPAS